MIHVLLTVLKIILIILASVIGLVLLVLLLLLFVPFRYSINVQKGGTVTARVKVTWLLHFLSVPVVYDGGLDVRVRILGATIKKIPGGGTDSVEGLPDAAEKSGESAGESAGKEEKKEKKEKNRGRAKPEDAEDKGKAVVEEESSTDKAREESAGEAEATEQGKPSVTAGVKGVFEGVRSKVKDIRDKVRGIFSKIRDIKNLVLDERTKQALKLVLSQAGYLLKKLMPKKVSGRVHFGFEDPSKTGEVLAGLGMAYPVVADSLEVVPDFEEEVIEGEVGLEGYFRLITIVVIAFRLVKDKNARYVFKKLAG